MGSSLININGCFHCAAEGLARLASEMAGKTTNEIVDGLLQAACEIMIEASLPSEKADLQQLSEKKFKEFFEMALKLNSMQPIPNIVHEPGNC